MLWACLCRQPHAGIEERVWLWQSCSCAHAVSETAHLRAAEADAVHSTAQGTTAAVDVRRVRGPCNTGCMKGCRLRRCAAMTMAIEAASGLPLRCVERAVRVLPVETPMGAGPRQGLCVNSAVRCYIWPHRMWASHMSRDVRTPRQSISGKLVYRDWRVC